MRQVINEVKINVVDIRDYTETSKRSQALYGRSLITNPLSTNVGVLSIPKSETIFKSVGITKSTYIELMADDFFYLVVVDDPEFQLGQSISTYHIIKTKKFSYSNYENPIYVFVANGSLMLSSGILTQIQTSKTVNIDFVLLTHSANNFDDVEWSTFT